MTLHDMTAVELRENLSAAGLDTEKIECYIRCWTSRDIQGQLKMLAAKRAELLASVHREERQIACLDYLVYLIDTNTAGA